MGTVHRIGLPPVVGRSPKVMILGTIPSVLSDRKQQYYGNPQNQFWKIVHRVFGSEPSAIYEERLAFLKERRIALWDVLHECDIEQSKDHSIINPVANDIETFLRSNQDITHVFLNGKKAFELFERLTLAKMPSEFSAPVIAALPSTSTANPVKFLKKVDEWKVILMALGS
ncbi:MAG: DNA-deoxyinosine glycosylase [Methanomassiliicoccales archaeon]|nr:DNA-deoxyinosine glycosylase [Methanomassiliicoccales archaeon]